MTFQKGLYVGYIPLIVFTFTVYVYPRTRHSDNLPVTADNACLSLQQTVCARYFFN